MVTINLRDDEALEKGINRFKKGVMKEGIITEVRRRQYFVKPSTLKHERNKKIKRKMAKKSFKTSKASKDD